MVANAWGVEQRQDDHADLEARVAELELVVAMLVADRRHYVALIAEMAADREAGR